MNLFLILIQENFNKSQIVQMFDLQFMFSMFRDNLEILRKAKKSVKKRKKNPGLLKSNSLNVFIIKNYEEKII